SFGPRNLGLFNPVSRQFQLSFDPVLSEFPVSFDRDFTLRDEGRLNAPPHLGTNAADLRHEVIGQVAVARIKQFENVAIDSAFLERQFASAGEICAGIALVPLHAAALLKSPHASRMANARSSPSATAVNAPAASMAVRAASCFSVGLPPSALSSSPYVRPL